MEFILIPLIVFLALIIKGIAGIGSATVMISLSVLIIDPKMAVILATFINIFGGIFMLRVDPVPLSRKFWISAAVAMGIGSVIGAFMLKIIDPRIFEILLGIVFTIIALRFLLKKRLDGEETKPAPAEPSRKDIGVATLAGMSSGFVGLSAIILIPHFSHILSKQYLRRFLVLILLPSAIVQTATHYWNSLLTLEIVYLGLLSVPMMIAGIYVGNKAHHKVSETWFKRILGGFLLVVSLKLIF